ncbi:MAG: DUF86 domain-containing protein [Clostridiales bacterium]|nr:DUF86 domain-containing protein [Clostridiales bacterium]
MDNIKNDDYYAGKIKEDLAFIVEHTKYEEKEELKNNEILQDSMMFRLIQISENARKLSNKFKTDHKSVPWQAIFGLRNRIVHDYGNVNLDIVYSTIKDDIPKLLEMLDSEL